METYDINLNNMCRVKHTDGEFLTIMDGKKQVAWCKENPNDKYQGTCKILNYDKIKAYNKPIGNKNDFIDNILDDTGIPCFLDKNGIVDLLENYPSSKYNLGDYVDVSKINEKNLIMKNKNQLQKQNFFSQNNEKKKILLQGFMIENIKEFINNILTTKKIDTKNIDEQKQLSNEIYEIKVYNVIDYLQYMKDNPLTSAIIILISIIILYIVIFHIILKK